MFGWNEGIHGGSDGLHTAWRLFHLHTSYLVPRYNPIRRIQWPKCLWSMIKVKVIDQCQKLSQNWLNTKHPHTSSYLLLQLFLQTHLGFALLFQIWSWPWPLVNFIVTLVINTPLSVSEIASKIWPIVQVFYHQFLDIWTWPVTFTLGQSHR